MNQPSPDTQTQAEAPRRRDRVQTDFDLRLALSRLQKRDCKISILAVATEAGVTPALLHNRYPDFAEEIRKLIGKETRSQRDIKHDLLVAERKKNRDLTEEIAHLKKDIAKLASINESLRVELTVANEISAGRVARLPPESAKK
jgi:SMC interacting uncharacterized protein involved in chromosome segregation